MIPGFDIRSIVVLLLVSTVLMTVILGLGPHSRRRDGLGKWIAGLGLVALGWFLIATREVLPPVLTVSVADSAMLGGLCLQVAALLEFGRKPLPWPLALPAPMLFGLMLPIQSNFMVYTLVASFVLAIPLLSLAVLAWKLGYGLARWPMALFYALGGALLILRALGIWFSSGIQAPVGLFHADVLSIVTFITLFAMTITGSFGFLEMRRQRAETEIWHLAMFDSLTDLLNRRAFLDLAERELSRARRTELPFSMLMIDIDHFKIVNDSYGHAVGDCALAAIAETAKRCLRREDLLGRYGGEEFCALLPCTNLKQGLLVAERIRAAIAKLKVDGIPKTVTVSIGVTICDDTGENEIGAGLQRADKALYHAKHSGRNRVIAYEAVSAETENLPHAAVQSA